MEMDFEPPKAMSRGLLTSGERDFYRGEKDVEQPDNYRGNIRYRFRQRMDNLEEDIEILRAAGEDDLVMEFYQRFNRVEQLERQIEEMRERLDESD